MTASSSVMDDRSWAAVSAAEESAAEDDDADAKEDEETSGADDVVTDEVGLTGEEEEEEESEEVVEGRLVERLWALWDPRMAEAEEDNADASERAKERAELGRELMKGSILSEAMSKRGNEGLVGEGRASVPRAEAFTAEGRSASSSCMRRVSKTLFCSSSEILLSRAMWLGSAQSTASLLTSLQTNKHTKPTNKKIRGVIKQTVNKMVQV